MKVHTDIEPFLGLFENRMGRMRNAFLVLDVSGRVIWQGIDQPPCTLIRGNTEDQNLLIIKCPGHNYWASLGEQGYAPAEYQIFWLIEKRSHSMFKCAYLGSVPIRSAEVDKGKAASLINLEVD